jgi:hypothetical protein
MDFVYVIRSSIASISIMQLYLDSLLILRLKPFCVLNMVQYFGNIFDIIDRSAVALTLQINTYQKGWGMWTWCLSGDVMVQWEYGVSVGIMEEIEGEELVNI